MPNFVVRRTLDAYAHYDTVIEAESEAEAVSIAEHPEYKGEWISGGHSEFDDVEVQALGELDDENAPIKINDIAVDDQEHATILAALRYYRMNGQGNALNRSDMIHDIATNGGDVISLSAEAIDALCERINV